MSDKIQLSQQQKSQIQNKQSSNAKLQLLTGAISGALSRTAVAPIERVIILKQTKNQNYLNNSIPQMLLNIVKQEGFGALFKGNIPNCIRIAPFQAIEFYTNDLYKRILTNQNILNENRTAKYLLSGALAGASATLFVYPLDLVKTILAVNTQNLTVRQSMFEVAKSVVQKNGILGLYKGIKPTLCGMMPYASLKLTFFQSLKDINSSYNLLNMQSAYVNLICGSLAGCMAVSITYPTDLIRRRMQIRVLNKEKDVGIYRTMSDIIKQDGIKGLYQGLGATYLKIIPSTALVFAINEYLKQKMNIN